MKNRLTSPKLTLILTLLMMATSTARSDSQIQVTLDNGMNKPLGNGYDSRKQSLRAQCVEGRPSSEFPEEGTISQGDIRLRVEADEGSTAEKLGFSVGGKARIGVVKISASADYYHESMSTGLSIAYNYSAEFMHHAYLVNRDSTPVKVRPGMEDYLRDGLRWQENCGDEFVSAWKRGARLLVSLRLDFVSSAEKSRFNAQFGAEGPLWSASGSLNTESAQFSKNTKFTINALQLGGDPSRLGTIFCSTDPDHANESCRNDARKVISCSFGDMGPCLEVMANIVAYGNGQDATSFPNQIRSFARYSTLTLETQPWSYLGSHFPLSPSSQEIQDYEATLTELSQLFEENHSRWVTSNRFARGKAPRLSPRQQDQMASLAAQFKTQMSSVAEVIRGCYDAPMSCSRAFEGLRTRLQVGTPHYPTETLINQLLMPESYAQYCDIASSTDALRIVISALNEAALEASGTSADKWRNGDVCQKGQEVLERMETLSLVQKNISDLRPIATLGGLRVLDLSQNRIADVSELRRLQSLTDLRLDDNLVRDVRPLVQIPGLQRLSLQNNRMETVEPLTSLPGLRSLDLRRNASPLVCPILDSSRCLTMDYASLGSFQRIDTLGMLQQPRVGQSFATLGNGNVLITGGVNALGESLAWAELFDAGSLTFRRMTPMKYARVQHTMTPLSDGCRVLITGGGAFGDKFEVYDTCGVEGGKVLGIGSLKASRTSHTATLLANGKVLIVGGWTGGLMPLSDRQDATATGELVDPTALETSIVGSLRVPRSNHAATSLPDGRVLISGGHIEGRGIDTLEIFDPARSTFHMVREAMKSGRSGHTAIALTDGKVLIAGGFGQDNAALRTAELFDPRTERRIDSMELNTPRGGQGALLLDQGKVLLIGGSTAYEGGISNRFQFSRGASALDKAEIYDPLTRTFNILNSMILGRSQPVCARLPDSRVFILGGMGSEDAAISAEVFEYSRMR